MGTYWDVHCLDCNSDLGLDDVRLDSVKLLIASAPILARLDGRSDQDYEGTYGFKVVTSCRDGRLDAKWFATHSGHRILPKSDYGTLYDSCDEPVNCNACSHVKFDCALVKGHDGEHAKTRP